MLELRFVRRLMVGVVSLVCSLHGQPNLQPPSPVFWRKDNANEKDRKRFYLLPGMGGRAYRRKQKLILKTAVAVGLLVSAVIAVVIYLLNRPGP